MFLFGGGGNNNTSKETNQNEDSLGKELRNKIVNKYT
jgi:hypothetical protein